ncbi:MAG TPA: hypothetical protein VKA53_11195 [Thermoanaerobaculia bacterium]|nr:hypothetical protein [Thermoanaerobaculia bacterium]
MSFGFILANLLAASDRAVGVLFFDETGEAVDLSCTDASPYEMRLLGAYLGIYLRQAEQFSNQNNLGEPRLIHLERADLQVQAASLPDGYFLALVQRRPAQAGPAREALLAAARQLTASLFEPPA